MTGGEWLVVAAGLVAGGVSGLIGTGSSLILLPVLALAYGPQEAIIVMSIAGLMGNAARVIAWWREVAWAPCLVYAAAGVPGAIMGAQTMIALPEWVVSLGLGLFFLLLLLVQRRLRQIHWQVPLWGMLPAGAGVGFLTGMLLSTGPLSVPVFLGYGLAKGAFIATEGAASLLLYVGKIGAFGEAGALPRKVLLQGALAGSAVMMGTFLSKRWLLKMPRQVFLWLADGLLLIAGLFFVARAF